MKAYPVIISHPRTGSHFLNGLIGTYSNRPRLRELSVQWAESNKRDYLYFHDHDLEMELDFKKLGHNKVLYLYRKSPLAPTFNN